MDVAVRPAFPATAVETEGVQGLDQAFELFAQLERTMLSTGKGHRGPAQVGSRGKTAIGALARDLPYSCRALKGCT